MKQSRKVVAVLSVMLVAFAGLATATATAAPAENATEVAGSPVPYDAPDTEAIEAFVERVEADYGLSLDPADYEVVKETAQGVRSRLIKPRDAEASPFTVRHKADGALRMSGAIQTEAEPPDDRVHRDSGVDWQEPTCFERDEWVDSGGAPIAWMDKCSQWANVYYANQTHWNWALKRWATCKSYQAYKLVGCELSGWADKESPPIEWNDWDPKQDQTLDGCTSYTLTVNVGPVSVPVSMNMCDEIDITKGEEAPNFSAKWKGDAYESERYTGYLLGLQTAVGDVPKTWIKGSIDPVLCNPWVCG